MKVSSELSDELKSLSKYIAVKSGTGDEIELLGLGHLNTPRWLHRNAIFVMKF